VSRLARLQVEKEEFSRERIGRMAAVPSERRHVFGSATGAASGRPLLSARSRGYHGSPYADLFSERRAIAGRNAGEDDVLDERLERDCQTGNIAFAVGRK
jgi:hypothetical protein